jgi:hypothetical protein
MRAADRLLQPVASARAYGLRATWSDRRPALLRRDNPRGTPTTASAITGARARGDSAKCMTRSAAARNAEKTSRSPSASRGSMLRMGSAASRVVAGRAAVPFEPDGSRPVYCRPCFRCSIQSLLTYREKTPPRVCATHYARFARRSATGASRASTAHRSRPTPDFRLRRWYDRGTSARPAVR